jgi:protein TonB
MFENANLPSNGQTRRVSAVLVAALLQAGAAIAVVVASMAGIDVLPRIHSVHLSPAVQNFIPERPAVEPVQHAAAANSPAVPVRAWDRRIPIVPLSPAPALFEDTAGIPDAGTPVGGGAGWRDLPAGSMFSSPAPEAPAAPKPAATPAEQPPVPVRVGGNVRAPKVIQQVQPFYPSLAKQARIQGTVRLQAIVRRDGSVGSLQLISGHPLLTQAAIDAVSRWRYQPTLLNGTPVEILLTVDVNFVLAQ